MKISKHWKILYLTVCLTGVATAQTARELFNPPAKEYIYGNNEVASNLVTQALAKYPDDEKLQKLKELIEQQQQDQQNQQNKNQDQEQSDESDSSEQQQEQQDEQEQQPEEQSQEEQEPQEAQPSQPQQAGEMSEEEAQQLLDAMKQNEKDQRSDLTPYLGQPVRVDKDW